MGYWEIDETYGTNASDSSVGGNEGTLTSMDPTTDWVTGKIEGAPALQNIGEFSSIKSLVVLDTGALWREKNAAQERWVHYLYPSRIGFRFSEPDFTGKICGDFSQSQNPRLSIAKPNLVLFNRKIVKFQADLDALKFLKPLRNGYLRVY